MKDTRYVQMYEAFLENLNEEEAKTQLKPVELKPAYNPLVYMLTALPFKSYDDFTEFLFTLNGSDWKNLYGDNTNPTMLLANMLSWSGQDNIGYIPFQGDIANGSMIYNSEQLDGDNLVMDFSSETDFIPFLQDYQNGKLTDSMLIKDYLVEIPKIGNIGGDMGFNKSKLTGFNEQLVGIKLEDFLNSKKDSFGQDKKFENPLFDKFGDKLYQNITTNLSKIKVDSAMLAKLGLRMNTYQDLFDVLSSLSTNPKKQLADLGLIDLNGTNVAYSEDAKKLINSKLKEPLKDSTGASSTTSNNNSLKL